MWVSGTGRPPYCGAPPTPANLWLRWNLDPVLIAVLLAVLAVYLIQARRNGWSGPRAAAFGAGWAVSAMALISPLCALSVSLFAARVGQHMILTLVGAPLIALGAPLRVMSGGRLGDGRQAIAAAVVFAVLLAFWHSPAPYQATFDSPAIYWAMHLSMIGSAIWLWSAILEARQPFAAAGAGAIVMLQMGFVGALVTLSPRALYGPHLQTTWAFGLSLLQDQQLGGAIMWGPGTLVFLAAAVILLWRGLEHRPVRAHRLATASAR